MLEGLVQHDHPLTLQHILERMRRLYGDAEVVTLTDDGTTRATYAEVGERVDRLCRGLAGARRRAGRPGGDVRLEHASATSRSTSRCRAWARCCTR